MAGSKTYLPDAVQLIWGVNDIKGTDDGTFLSISRNTEGWTKKVGADGEVLRVRSNDYTHTIEVTLMQSSEFNAILSAQEELDRLTGTAVFPFTALDLSGFTLRFWPEAWLVSEADSEYAKEAGNRVWTFSTGQVALGANIVGGN